MFKNVKTFATNNIIRKVSVIERRTNICLKIKIRKVKINTIVKE